MSAITEIEGAVLPALEELLLGDAEKYATAMAVADQKRFPAYTAAELTTQVDGDLKHQVRVALGFLGFAVDFGWTNPAYQADLEPLIEAAVAGLPQTGGLAG